MNCEKEVFMDEKITDDSPDWARKPKEQKYASCNFETIGKCPRCEKMVASSIGHTDMTCKNCGLKLWWGKW